MVRAKVWYRVTSSDGPLSPSEFVIKEEEVRSPKDKEYLCEAECWAVDPYNRFYTKQGKPVVGYQLAQVIESKSEKFPVGSRVVGELGWRTHTLVSENEAKAWIAPNCDPISLAVGTVGMPGLTAYFHILEVCKPKPGDTMVVTSGAGGVGSCAGQIAKIMGCKVIGYAGSDDKVKWIKDELGCDYAFNYKTVDFDQSLKQAAPNGVDCFFDNVGGLSAMTVYNHLNRGARIAQPGTNSNFGVSSEDFAKIAEKIDSYKPRFEELGITKRSVYVMNPDWLSRFPEGVAQLVQWVKEGKIKYRETVLHGFDQIPQGLFDLFSGKAIGKVVVMKA